MTKHLKQLTLGPGKNCQAMTPPYLLSSLTCSEVDLYDQFTTAGVIDLNNLKSSYLWFFPYDSRF